MISTQVATEWKWKEDDPAMIVAEAVRLHVAMINECKGVPGVLEERWREAHTVRHCALSLVGEPIMYPRINELIGELHARKISSFLVTNAQFPEAIRTLRPVTQLYVSVDAPNKDDLDCFYILFLLFQIFFLVLVAYYQLQFAYFVYVLQTQRHMALI